MNLKSQTKNQTCYYAKNGAQTFVLFVYSDAELQAELRSGTVLLSPPCADRVEALSYKPKQEGKQ